jgi:PAS domain-containing protein
MPRPIAAASEERYRGLLEHPTEFVVLLEAVRTAAGEIEAWRYVDANRNAIRILRASRETLLGKRISEVLPDRAERVIALCTEVLQTRSPRQYESAFGEVEFLTHVFPIGSDTVVASGTDVTAC